MLLNCSQLWDKESVFFHQKLNSYKSRNYKKWFVAAIAALFFSYAWAETPKLSNTADDFARALSQPGQSAGKMKLRGAGKLRGLADITDDQSAKPAQPAPALQTKTQTSVKTNTAPAIATPKPVTSTQSIASPQVKPVNFQTVAAQNYRTLTQTHAVAAALVQFETNSDKIRRNTYGVLNELAKALQTSLPDAVLIVAGHTDSKGSAKYNLKLSQRRAQSVKNYLVKRGIASQRLIAKGYGEAHPMASNKTADGRSLNRRSEFIRIGSL